MRILMLLAVVVCCGCSAEESSADTGDSGADAEGERDATPDVEPDLDDPIYTCEKEREVPPDGEPRDFDPAVADKVRDNQGTVSEDQCNEEGNLIEFHCEQSLRCTSPPNPTCRAFQTGKVTSRVFDCDGSCEAGACDARCPAFGQKISYIELQPFGRAMIGNSADDRTYSCKLLQDSEADDFSCVSSPTSTTTGRIRAVTLISSYCTAGEIGTIAIDIEGVSKVDGGNCVYSCSLAPTS